MANLARVAAELISELNKQGVEGEASALIDWLCTPQGAQALEASKRRGGYARLAAHAIAEGRTNGSVSSSLSRAY